MKRLSLKIKIIFSTVVVGVLLSLVLGLFIFKYLNNQLIDQKIDEISRLNTEQVHESIQIMEKYKVFTKMLGTRTRVKEYLLDRSDERRLELDSIFNIYTKEDSRYLSIYLLDDKGVGLVSTDTRFIGQDYSFRDYFKKAMTGIPFMDVSIGKTSKQFGYYFSYPVRGDNDSILGVLVVKINNMEIDNAILNSEISKNSTVMLVDRYGVVLVSNRPERFLRSLGNVSPENKEEIRETDRLLGQELKALQYDEIQKAVDDYKGVKTIKFYDEEDGETEIVSVSKLSDMPFFLVSEIGLEEIEKIIESTSMSIIIIMLAGIMIFSLITYKFILVFISPLEKFKMVLGSISKGDFSQKIEIKTKDEFGDLALVFNDMTDKLKNSYSVLEDKIKQRTIELEEERGSLEKKISERTMELEELKNDLEKMVGERTQNLNEKLSELEKMNKLMVDRELKMIEMKKQIDDFKKLE